MKKDHCDFCLEATTGYLEGLNILPRKRIIHETENFIVFPTLGPLVQGHLLIASKEHFIGIAGLAESLYDEFETVQEWTRKKLAEKYQAPIFFEHGDITEARGSGSCVSHTHLHAVPIGVDITCDLERKFDKKEIKKYVELKQNQRAYMPYMFVQTRDGTRYVFDVPDVVPSQYARQIVAIKIGKPERWNWRTATDLNTNLRETMQTFYALNENSFERWIGRDHWVRQHFDFQGDSYHTETGERRGKLAYLEDCAQGVERVIQEYGTITARELGNVFAWDAFCGDGDDHIGNNPMGPMLVNKLTKWSVMQGRVEITYPTGRKPKECSWEEKIYRMRQTS